MTLGVVWVSWWECGAIMREASLAIPRLLSPLQVYVGVAVFFTSFLVLLRYKLEFSAWVR
jgi:hypothetical protein